jgi:hypothetical protein
MATYTTQLLGNKNVQTVSSLYTLNVHYYLLFHSSIKSIVEVLCKAVWRKCAFVGKISRTHGENYTKTK